jgi:hypothetical protein
VVRGFVGVLVSRHNPKASVQLLCPLQEILGHSDEASCHVGVSAGLSQLKTNFDLPAEIGCAYQCEGAAFDVKDREIIQEQDSQWRSSYRV